MNNIFDGTLVVEHDKIVRDCIDRTEETRLCLSGILALEKIMICGERGTGKTFLLKKIERMIKENHRHILPIYFTFSSTLSIYNSHLHNINYMLNYLLAFVWEKILGHKTSLLYSKHEIKATDNELDRLVKTIYNLCHRTEEKTYSQAQNEFKEMFSQERGIKSDASGKTAKSILISCGARLAPFDIKELREVMSYDEMELDTLGDKKTVLFIIISDTDDSFSFIAAMMYTQLFKESCF